VAAEADVVEAGAAEVALLAAAGVSVTDATVGVVPLAEVRAAAPSLLLVQAEMHPSSNAVAILANID
jgi:hypothetical protein